MNILGIGVDIIEIYRIKEILDKNPRFLEKVFTSKEIEYFESKDFRPETIAGNFVAKEAISKSIGTGIRKFNLRDIEVLRDELGKPTVKTYNNLKDFENQLSDDFIKINRSCVINKKYAKIDYKQNTMQFTENIVLINTISQSFINKNK